MQWCMRTTVDLSPEVLADAKALAHEHRTTLSSVVEGAIREALARHASAGTAEHVDLPVSGRPDTPPLVDILDKDALAAVLGENWGRGLA